jgi:selenide,water dikinase
VRYAPPLRLADWEERLLNDPQTSGGLLIAVASESMPALVEKLRAGGDGAFVIGAVVPGAGEIQVR